MIRRPPRSTQSRSSAASEVDKRQVALVAYDIKMSTSVALIWANDTFDAGIYSGTIVFLILLGLLLEVRLVLTMVKKS